MRATILQRPGGSFTVVIPSIVAGQFRLELRGESIKGEETPSVQEGKDMIAFSFSPTVAVEDIEKVLETLGYDFTTLPAA